MAGVGLLPVKRGNMYSALILLLSLVLPINAYSQKGRRVHSQKSSVPCSEAPSPSRRAMDECDYKLQQKAEVALNRVYEKLKLNMNERDKATLEQSHQSWVTFRDANCAMASDFVYRQCMIRMAQERHTELLQFKKRFLVRQ